MGNRTLLLGKTGEDEEEEATTSRRQLFLDRLALMM